MKRWLAYRVNRALLEQNERGQHVLPGANVAQRWVQPDGTETTLISRGDAFDLYIGRRTIYNVTLSFGTAVAIAKWILSWWVRSTWCGIKHRLWYWSLGELLQEPETDDGLEKTAASGVAGR